MKVWNSTRNLIPKTEGGTSPMDLSGIRIRTGGFTLVIFSFTYTNCHNKCQTALRKVTLLQLLDINFLNYIDS